MQNKSHAVMAQRTEPKSSLDDFPTPPWATRALIEHVIKDASLDKQSCLEPACNRGFMSAVLEEYFETVTSSDVFDYGVGETRDFLGGAYEANSFDWVITNPPFRLAEDFFFEANKVARQGVALLTRTVFIESVGRHQRLFTKYPPTFFAQFTERVPMVKGRIDKKASTATGYGWLVWRKTPPSSNCQLVWIPQCRKSLEYDGDYELPKLKSSRLSPAPDLIENDRLEKKTGSSSTKPGQSIGKPSKPKKSNKASASDPPSSKRQKKTSTSQPRKKSTKQLTLL
jgi:hypothetical protein